MCGRVYVGVCMHIIVRNQEPSQHTLNREKFHVLALTCLRKSVLSEISSC